MAFGIYDIRMPFIANQQFLPADGTGTKVLYTPNFVPLLMADVLLTNSDTIAHVVNVLFYDGTVYRHLGSVNVPAGQGYAGTPPIYLGASILPPILQAWLLDNQQALCFSLVVAMSAATVLDIVGFGGYV